MSFSYWETSEGLQTADHLVIGMGLVGLQTAILLKEKNPKATVICADRFAWGKGASTKNAGFACFANATEILDDLKNQPENLVFDMIGQRYRGIHLLLEKVGTDVVDYEPLGTREVFFKNQKESMALAIDSLQYLNTCLSETIHKENVLQFKAHLGKEHSIGEILNPYEGQLNTGKLYSALHAKAKNVGVRLLGGLDYTSHKTGNKIEVLFNDNDTFTCGNIWFCTNGFANPFILDQKIEIVPARGQVLITEPIDSLHLKGGFMNDAGYYYWRNVGNRVLLGGARNRDKDSEKTTTIQTNDQIINHLTTFLEEKVLGQKVSISQVWSGIMGMQKGNYKRPSVGHSDKNEHYAIGLGGMGVALSACVAEDLVSGMDY